MASTHLSLFLNLPVFQQSQLLVVELLIIKLFIFFYLFIHFFSIEIYEVEVECKEGQGNRVNCRSKSASNSSLASLGTLYESLAEESWHVQDLCCFQPS